jgi:hypothetical protein
VAYRYKDQPLASRAIYSNYSPLPWRITTSTTSQSSTSYLGERCSKLGTEVGLLTSVCSTLVDVIRIRVTESSDERDFYIPEDMLVRRAPNFTKIIRKRPGYENLVSMDDIDIETFSIFMAWLKFRPHIDLFGPLYRNSFRKTSWTSGMPLAKLYIFACEYEIPELGSRALYRLESLVHRTGGMNQVPQVSEVDSDVCLTLTEIAYVYENTASDSALRPIIVEAFCVADKEVNYSLMTCDTEFLVDVIMFMRER